MSDIGGLLHSFLSAYFGSGQMPATGNDANGLTGFGSPQSTSGGFLASALQQGIGGQAKGTVPIPGQGMPQTPPLGVPDAPQLGQFGQAVPPMYRPLLPIAWPQQQAAANPWQSMRQR